MSLLELNKLRSAIASTCMSGVGHTAFAAERYELVYFTWNSHRKCAKN